MKKLISFFVVVLCLAMASGCGSPATATPPENIGVTQVPPNVSPTAPQTTLPFPSLQVENNLQQTLLSPRPSQELPDNHIGVHTEGFNRYSESTEDVLRNGFKRIRIQSLTEFEGEGFGVKTFLLDSIPPEVDEVINNYIDNGVIISLDLWLGTGYPINFTDYDTNYKSEEEIDAYLNNVELVVQHFKGRISSYEILNEPGYISLETYTNLIKRTVPVIREIDPEAKIIIGSTPGNWENGFPGYVSMVDAISWHPFYDNIPGDPYYQDYPQIVQGIKDLATSQGFSGEYFADEILWRTVTEEGFDGGPPLSHLIAAKYYTRAIAEHRGLGLNVTINIFFQSPFLAPIHNLNDTLAGAEPIDITLSLKTNEDANVRYYAFTLPSGDKLVTLWTNDEAIEDDPGVSATLTFPDFSAEKVTGIDVFNGFEQELTTENDNGNLVIRDLLVKDYPIHLRFSGANFAEADIMEPDVTETLTTNPFSGEWEGPDPIDNSVITLSLTQTGSKLSVCFPIFNWFSC